MPSPQIPPWLSPAPRGVQGSAVMLRLFFHTPEGGETFEISNVFTRNDENESLTFYDASSTGGFFVSKKSALGILVLTL